ncbi:MAG: hypothetical protein V5A55_06140 [Halovenus sp.]
MPSSSRRRLLAAVGTAALAGAAGCVGSGNDRPDVNPGTGLSQDTSQALDDEAIYVVSADSDLPTPPTAAGSLADATAVLAAATADRAPLTQAVRAGKPVAIVGDSAPTTMRGLLASVRGEYSFGVEMVRARPVEVVVIDPRGDTVETYTFVADGGWKDPVLDPFGWALAGRVPESDTALPESAMDDAFEYAGAAHVVGRLPTGETYASRSVASVAEQDDWVFVDLQTTLHAAANDGYAIEEALREADLPDDQHLDTVYPNPHTQNGVQITNVSSTVQSTFGIELTPESPRARSALTGSGGFRTESALAYDYRTSVQWKHDTLLDTDRHYATATGRGEWAFRTSEQDTP